MTNKLFKIFKDSIYVFTSFTLVMFLCQCALIYPGARQSTPNNHQVLEVIKVKTSDDVEVEVLKNAPQKIILVCQAWTKTRPRRFDLPEMTYHSAKLQPENIPFFSLKRKS